MAVLARCCEHRYLGVIARVSVRRLVHQNSQCPARQPYQATSARGSAPCSAYKGTVQCTKLSKFGIIRLVCLAVNSVDTYLQRALQRKQGDPLFVEPTLDNH